MNESFLAFLVIASYAIFFRQNDKEINSIIVCQRNRTGYWFQNQ